MFKASSKVINTASTFGAKVAPAKSFTVIETLKALAVSYKLTNSRTTPKGLFDALRDFPDVVHVIEDAESMFNNSQTFGVLRSALWGQVGPDGKQERVVCWQTARRRDEFVFTGGIVVVANCPLDDFPEARALKTRMAHLQYLATNEEVAALMRHISKKGHSFGPYSLTPDECRQAADAIIARSERLTRNLDLRLLSLTYQDMLQFKNGASETHWQDLLESRMKERVLPRAEAIGVRAQRKEREYGVLRRIADLPTDERLAAWKAETGKSQAAMYRRLGELQPSDSHFSQSS